MTAAPRSDPCPRCGKSINTPLPACPYCQEPRSGDPRQRPVELSLRDRVSALSQSRVERAIERRTSRLLKRNPEMSAEAARIEASRRVQRNLGVSAMANFVLALVSLYLLIFANSAATDLLFFLAFLGWGLYALGNWRKMASRPG